MGGKDYFLQIPQSVNIIAELVADGHKEVAQELALNTLLYAMDKDMIDFSEVMTEYVFAQIKDGIDNLRRYREEKAVQYRERASRGAMSRWGKHKAETETDNETYKPPQKEQETDKGEVQAENKTENKKNGIVIDVQKIEPYDAYKIDENLFEAIAQNEKRWVEAFCANRHISADTMKQKIKEFAEHLQSLGVFSKEKADFKKHFVSWCDKQEQKNGKTYNRLTATEERDKCIEERNSLQFARLVQLNEQAKKRKGNCT